jgi:hypothetical protein
MKADATAILRAPALTQASPGIGFAGSEALRFARKRPGGAAGADITRAFDALPSVLGNQPNFTDWSGGSSKQDGRAA